MERGRAPQTGGTLASRPYGWLAGILVSLVGLGIAIIGGVTYSALRGIMGETAEIYESYESMGSAHAGEVSPERLQTFCVVAVVMLAAGVALAIAGAVLTIHLRRRRTRTENKSF